MADTNNRGMKGHPSEAEKTHGTQMGTEHRSEKGASSTGDMGAGKTTTRQMPSDVSAGAKDAGHKEK